MAERENSMRKTVAIVVLLILGNGGGGCRAQAPTPGPENDISSLRSEWVHDLQTKQLEPIMVLYTAESGFMSPDGSRLSGRDAIRAFLRLVFEEISSNIVLESRHVEFSGDMAYDSGVYWETLTSIKSGSKQQINGSYLMVLRHEPDGKWRIAQQMFTQGSTSNGRAPAG
jgi:uncharacterized protein (TIGR02246 family)